MLGRLLGESVRRRPRRTGAAVLAVGVGAALASGLLGVSLDITERMGRELRSYGANILVTPEGADLKLEMGGITISPPTARGLIDEDELPRLKSIFWRHNIVGFAPFLSAPVEVNGARVVLTGTWFDRSFALPGGTAISTGPSRTEKASEASRFRTGIRSISSWWQVEGGWADDGEPQTAMVGARVARHLGLRLGGEFRVKYGERERALRVVGVVASGGDEEEQIFVPLVTVQGLLGLSGGVDKVWVSSLVEPEEKLRADLRGLDPDVMTPEQYETWYCSPIMGAVLTQIEEVLPGTRARPVRRIAEAEGSFLIRIGLLMTLLTVVALVAAALAVMTTMTAAVLERRAEIGLFKAVGADDMQIALIFLSEAALIGLAGGALGSAAGMGVAVIVGKYVFATAVSPPLLVLPVIIVVALCVALAGSALPVRRAMRFDPIVLLHGG